MNTSGAGADADVRRKIRRIDHLDGVRGFAALYVVVSHSWDTVFAGAHGPTGPLRLATVWMGGGRYAVTVFIVVSGFSLGLTFWRNGGSWPGGPRDFLVRRARRLVPPYWAAIAFGALIATFAFKARSGTLFDGAIPTRWGGIVSHVLALQDVWWNGPAGSTTFWSLAVELHIYLAFALALLLASRWCPPWMLVYLVLCAATVAPHLGPRPWLLIKLDSLYPSLYAMFLIGLAAARFAVHDDDWARAELPRWWRQMTLCGLAGLVATILSLRTLSFNSPVLDLVVGPVATAVLVAMTVGRLRLVSAIASSRVGVWLGHSSYSLYLVHSVLLELVWRTLVSPLDLPPAAQLALQLAAGLLVSIAVARVFYRFVERPFMSRRSRPPEGPGPHHRHHRHVQAVIIPRPHPGIGS